VRPKDLPKIGFDFLAHPVSLIGRDIRAEKRSQGRVVTLAKDLPGQEFGVE
jgi:hypothetical protein